MNTVNNKRRKESQEKIEKVFVQLLQNKEISEISITDICKKSNLNRSTFYANYIDIYDLAEKVRDKLEADVADLYKDEIRHNYNSNNYLKLFKHIKENQLFYKTYFKLGFDKTDRIGAYDTDLAKLHFNDKFINYHIQFFRCGLNGIIKYWINNGCKETPEEINSILLSEYENRTKQD